MRSSPTTARSSPAGSVPSPWRCCSIGSAGRTASHTATRHLAHRRPPARSSSFTRACARSSWSTARSPPSRPLRPNWTRGSPATTPHARTRPWRWPRRPAVQAHADLDRRGLGPGRWGRGPTRSVGPPPRRLQRGRLGRQPDVLGRQRLQSSARRRLRGRDHHPGLEQEPPHQDRRQDQDRTRAEDAGRRFARQASAEHRPTSISRNLTEGTT
jgi:hypothetical protein